VIFAVARASPMVRTSSPHAPLLGSEYALDMASHTRAGGTAAGDVRRHRPAARFGPLELHNEPASIQQR
jgi:hypothetical protein